MLSMRLSCLCAMLLVLSITSLLPALAGAQPPVYFTQWGSFGSGNGQFSNPVGLATGAFGEVFVADTGNDRIQKFGSAPTPTRTTSWGRIKSMYR